LIASTGARFAALVTAILLAACNQSAPPSDKPLVATSFYPLYEFTRQITGTAARVISLVPAGVEPHDWEPSPQDLTRIREARAFVYNGAGLEPWIPKLMQDAPRSGTVLIRATEGIPLLTSADGKRDAAPTDPHVWLDPVLAVSMVEQIRAGLAKADPAHAPVFGENARTLTGRLQTLHQSFEDGLRSCARRDVVTSHAAFAYLARRYRLHVIPVMGVGPESEPTPADLAAIIRFAREKKVKYIFSETLVSPKLAETLAREVGAGTLVFNPIEGVTPEEAASGADYFTLMEANLKNLRRALDCT
jgi:zinc transport system substrate-binding protein